MINFQRTGYEGKSLLSNIALGAMDGSDSVLWFCVFATILFPGTLSVFFPVGLTVLLLGWAFVSLFVVLTSAVKVNVVSIDEQAVVIIGAVGGMLVEEMGPAAGGTAGISTMLAVFAITSLFVAGAFFAVGFFKIVRLLELIPYPVICGFMAGIAWLLLDAGVMVSTGSAISGDLLPALQQQDNLLKLLLFAAGGVVLLWLTNRFARPWVLPAAAVALIFLFYSWAWGSGVTHQELVAAGWLFGIETGTGGVARHFGAISVSDIDWSFIASIVPDIASIGFLCVLGAAMEVSAITSIKFATPINSADEIKSLAYGNLLCGLVCCPPGYTDASASLLNERFGASTRWMPITSSALLLLVVPFGVELISFLPTILVGAMIFLYSFELFKEWMYEDIQKFDFFDYIIVWIILLSVIFFGLVEGIVAGFILSFVIFSLRFALVSPIRGQYTLNNYRSSVERSSSSNDTLDEYGGECLVLTLRGYLFFGTTNSIRDVIKENVNTNCYTMILLDFYRVTGIDVSALQTFRWTKNFCESNNVHLLYSSLPAGAVENIVAMGAVSKSNGKELFFSEIDFAIEYIEEKIIEKYGKSTGVVTVLEHMKNLVGDYERAQIVEDLMVRVEIEAGSRLFRQGDPDNGFYVLEKGALSELFSDVDGNTLRINKFSPGSLIGELSGHTDQKKRTTSIVADEPSVLYHLNTVALSIENTQSTEAFSAIHELLARTLSKRIAYMNRRLANEVQR